MLVLSPKHAFAIPTCVKANRGMSISFGSASAPFYRSASDILINASRAATNTTYTSIRSHQPRLTAPHPLRQAAQFTRSASTMMSAAASGRMLKTLDWQPEFPTVTVQQGEASSWEGDLLAILVPEEAFQTTEGITTAQNGLAKLDSEFKGLFSEFCTLNEFAGKEGTSASARYGQKQRHVALIGVGPAAKAKAVAEWGMSPFQAAGSVAATLAKTLRSKSAAVALLDLESLSDSEKADAAGKVAAGIFTGAYEATRFKAKPKLSNLESIQILTPGNATSADSAIRAAKGFASGTGLARYLVEAPANICTPAYLAETAGRIRDLAPECFTLDVHERERVEELGMGLYLGVAEASAVGNDLRLIHLVYKPDGNIKKRVGLVGKGVTFDTGGYNIKAGAGSMIEMMKFDMGGSGAVLGAARALADLQPDGVEIHFIIPATENMIDGKGMRPGDVLTAPGGQTVEVNNTDAEGRLTLADGLWFAQEHAHVEAVIDIATLTGAMMVALGQGISGHFTDSEDLADNIKRASAHAGEKTWRLPIEKSYASIMDSNIADMKNAGSKYAGSITAALFLDKFVDTKKCQWAHMDIAGTAWDDTKGGATGYGAALLAQWCILEGQ